MMAKFKVGDKVKVIATRDELEEEGFLPEEMNTAGQMGCIKEIAGVGLLVHPLYVVSFPDLELFVYFDAKHLELIVEPPQKENNGCEELGKRVFESGASKDTAEDKPSYMKALDPAVLRCYVEYLGRHRDMPDGSKRDWDNWKKGIPMDVHLDSMLRHVWAVWLLRHGYGAADNHGPVTLSDSLCGIMFAVNGMLYEMLQDEKEREGRR